MADEETNTAVAEVEATEATDDTPNPQAKEEDADQAIFDSVEEGVMDDGDGEPAETEEPQQTTEEPEGQDSDPAQPDYSKAIGLLEKTDASDDLLEQVRSDPESAAMSQILREGYPRERANEWLEKDPEGFVAYAIKRLSNQVQVDRYSGQVQQETAKVRQEAAKAEPEPDVLDGLDLSLALDPVVKQVTDIYDEDLGKTFKDLGEGVARTVLKSVGEQIEQQRKLSSALANQLEWMEIKSVRENMSEQFPALKDEGKFADVMKEYGELVQTGRYQTVDDAFGRAVKIALEPATLEDLQTQTSNRQKRRKNSQPRVKGASAATATKPKTDEDLDREAFESAVKGNE